MHELKPAASIGRTLSIPRTATIEGGIDYPGPLVVEGTVLGDVNCLSLVVAERGIVEGTIKSETVTVAGEVSGEIFANELILKAVRSMRRSFTRSCSLNPERSSKANPGVMRARFSLSERERQLRKVAPHRGVGRNAPRP